MNDIGRVTFTLAQPVFADRYAENRATGSFIVIDEATNDTVAATSFLSVKGRVARALLTLADEFGRDVGQGRIVIQQKVSQGDLAAMAGIARENVSRILNEWKRDAVVSRLSSYYCLENKKKLERESEF